MHLLHPYTYVELYTYTHIHPFSYTPKHPYNCIGGMGDMGCVSCGIACVVFYELHCIGLHSIGSMG